MPVKIFTARVHTEEERQALRAEVQAFMQSVSEPRYGHGAYTEDGIAHMEIRIVYEAPILPLSIEEI